MGHASERTSRLLESFVITSVAFFARSVVMTAQDPPEEYESLPPQIDPTGTALQLP